MEHRSSLPCSKERTARPFPVLDESRSHHHNLWLCNSFYYYLPIYA